MKKDEISKLFASTFQQANNNLAAHTFSSAIRFIAIVLVILAVMWSINHFMTAQKKLEPDYLLLFGSRLVRLVIGLTLFILILTV